MHMQLTRGVTLLINIVLLSILLFLISCNKNKREELYGFCRDH